MKVFAQTNLQLFNQLERLGRPPDDLALAQRAYALAVRIFAGQYRPSGKPFVCHLVGTASILADQGAAIEVVGAGLLHAAYTHGEFGSGWKRMSHARSNYLRRTIGDYAEHLVAEYAQFPWNRGVILDLSVGELGELPSDRRQVLLLRLANELEDHLELGPSYCSDAVRRRADIASHLVTLSDVASRLQYTELALLLSEAFRDCLQASPQVQSPPMPHSDSFCLAPLSYRPRLGARINAFLEGRGRRWLRACIGWRRGTSAERAIREIVDRWSVQL